MRPIIERLNGVDVVKKYYKETEELRLLNITFSKKSSDILMKYPHKNISKAVFEDPSGVSNIIISEEFEFDIQDLRYLSDEIRDFINVNFDLEPEDYEKWTENLTEVINYQCQLFSEISQSISFIQKFKY